MFRALRVLLEKEFLQIRRDPVIWRMLLVVPMIQLMVLANAATFEVKASNLWVVDQDRTPMARALVERFEASGRFQVVGMTMNAGPGNHALLDGDANVILSIPTGFERDLMRTRHATVQLVLDAENGSQAGITQVYSTTIIASYANELNAVIRAPLRLASPGKPTPYVAARPTVDVRRRSWYNPTLSYAYFMVPGILVQLVTLVGTLMTALNIVREKEAGTLDQLNVTPIRPAVFIAAKLLPLWIIGLAEFAMGLTIARLVFGVPMVGSLWVVFAGAAVFLVAALGIGLWVSTVAETQQQALFVTFSLLMVYILMSGLFTPVRAMPEWVQYAAQINPMMHFISLVRAVLLKGAGLADVARQLYSLAAIGVVILTLSVGQYHKRAG